MAIQNVIGDSFRGATWGYIHNGGGVGWGEVINGGFGMLIDGSEKSEINIESMLFGMLITELREETGQEIREL